MDAWGGYSGTGGEGKGKWGRVYLADAVAGEWADVGGLLGEDDVFFRHPGADKLRRDRTVGAVVLNSDLAVDDIEVEHDGVDTAAALPSGLDEFEVVEDGIENEFGPEAFFWLRPGGVSF